MYVCVNYLNMNFGTMHSNIIKRSKHFILCAYKALVNTIEDDGVEHAGYMSFMVILSLFPFLVFFLSFTSIVGASEVGSNFVQLLLDNMPESTTQVIRLRINELVLRPPQQLLTLAIIGTIWTSSSFVEGLRTILNRVYKIQTPPPYLFRRMLSIAQFLFISLIIFVIMIFLVMAPIALEKLSQLIPMLKSVPSIKYIENLFLAEMRYVMIFFSLIVTSASLYYLIPNIKLKIIEVLPGSVLTTVLWFISGDILSSYISYYSKLTLIYGSLGNIIISLLFFYIVNMIFIYGAEFNYLLFRKK